jgi:crotonobetainyl-CoA:carnitine CoA-transferase CaiB-like acyl-CoA transferase
VNSSEAVSGRPLRGVRVISFGAFVAGNVCDLLLAELGADVVKIEAHERPEALRAYFSVDHPNLYEPSGTQTTVMFAGLARSARGICVNMKEPSGVDVLRRLAAASDVLIENLGPGQMEAWGCSHEALRAVNPKLVNVSISGYGRTGPISSYRAYASNISNYLGLSDLWATDGTHFDHIAAVHAASAVIAGLATTRQRREGVYIDIAQTEAGAAVMAPIYLDFLANGRDWEAGANEVPGALLSAVVACRGFDAWAAVELDDYADWNILCDTLERPDLRLDRETPSSEAGSELRTALEQWASQLTPFQCAVKLQRVGLAAAPVQTSEDLWRDPQLRSRHAYAEITHPDIGRIEYPQSPAGVATKTSNVTRAARLGEHTRAVLVEWLGLDAAEFDELISANAIWDAESVPAQLDHSAP